ncbi:hypothetical protein GCM10009676_11200 [Prauserella halophila]|uniref:Carboxymuconolactone decarboxylase-like domain-containing protein n=1 Tax=Prauserella halophila TaxID=185641 RepID=A0ABN1W1P8_9PSEU|nr:carboxymuconolactone decarboxylase family protein [Prauserella halophila]
MHSHHEEAAFLADIKEAAPDVVSAFFGFDKAVFDKNPGNLDLAIREMIAVGVAVTTQCAYCIEDHAKRGQGRSTQSRGRRSGHGRRRPARRRRRHSRLEGDEGRRRRRVARAARHARRSPATDEPNTRPSAAGRCRHQPRSARRCGSGTRNFGNEYAPQNSHPRNF